MSTTAASDLIWLILSLLIVIGIIFALALLMRRFVGGQAMMQGKIKVLSITSLSHKEKLALIQVGDTQLLIGVTSQQITLLHELPEPLAAEQKDDSPFAKKLTALIGSKGFERQANFKNSTTDSIDS